jgi:hypothetical protein
LEGLEYEKNPLDYDTDLPVDSFDDGSPLYVSDTEKERGTQLLGM